MKTRKIIRDCRLEGDGVHHAMLGIARLHPDPRRIDGWIARRQSRHCAFDAASEIDAAYRNKYGQAAGPLAASPAAHAATIRIDPAPSSNGATGLVR